MPQQPTDRDIVVAYDALEYLCWCLDSGTSIDKKLLAQEKADILKALPPHPPISIDDLN